MISTINNNTATTIIITVAIKLKCNWSYPIIYLDETDYSIRVASSGIIVMCWPGFLSTTLYTLLNTGSYFSRLFIKSEKYFVNNHSEHIILNTTYIYFL